METIRIKDETELKKFWNEENGRYEPGGVMARFLERWNTLKRICRYAGVRLEFIPIDDKPYCVSVVWPDNIEYLERAKTEIEAVNIAIHFFGQLEDATKGGNCDND